MKLIWSKITGFIRSVIVPDFVLGREKVRGSNGSTWCESEL